MYFTKVKKREKMKKIILSELVKFLIILGVNIKIIKRSKSKKLIISKNVKEKKN